jgi:penicillin-binding protein 2
MKSVFADHILGIDLAGEEHGFVPTPEWKESERGEPWYQGDSYNISIGQGDLSVTPLWINTYIAAVANGGTLYQPQVAHRITDANGEVVKSLVPEVLGKMPFSAENLAEVKSDMEETVISGTAQILKDLPVKVAAKTGTAEVVKHQSINSLFTVFAPAANPELTMTVLVEGSASNEGYAIRIANEVLKWYFNRGTVAQ